MLYESVQDLIGNTPLVKINRMGLPEGINAYAKLELLNPAGGVKDRVGKAMIDDAEATGRLKPGGTIIEVTAGNTGLGVAFAALGRGYRVIFVIPEKFSVEKQILMRALGAEIVSTPADEGMAGGHRKAQDLLAEIPDSIMLGQFVNPANPRVHFETTGPEIWRDLNGQVDYFVAGAGSGGTFTGVMQYFKGQNPKVQGVLVDPVGSQMGPGLQGAWDIEGIGNLEIPDTMDMSLVDQVTKVDSADAKQMCQELARREGIFAGPSSGADMVATTELAKRLAAEGKTDLNIVTIFPDRGARYFSKHLYE